MFPPCRSGCDQPVVRTLKYCHTRRADPQLQLAQNLCAPFAATPCARNRGDQLARAGAHTLLMDSPANLLALIGAGAK